MEDPKQAILKDPEEVVVGTLQPQFERHPDRARFYYKSQKNPRSFHHFHGKLPLWKASTHLLFMSLKEKLDDASHGSRNFPEIRAWAGNTVKTIDVFHTKVGNLYSELVKMGPKLSVVAAILGLHEDIPIGSIPFERPAKVCVWFHDDHKRPGDLLKSDDVTLGEATIQQVMRHLRDRVDLAIRALPSAEELKEIEQKNRSVLMASLCEIEQNEREFVATESKARYKNRAKAREYDNEKKTLRRFLEIVVFDQEARAILVTLMSDIDKVYQGMPNILKAKLEPMDAPLVETRPLSTVRALVAALPAVVPAHPKMSQPISYAAAVRKTVEKKD